MKLNMKFDKRAQLDGDEGDGPVLEAGDLPGCHLTEHPGFFSKLLFLFIDPLMRYGYRHTLQPSDTLHLHDVDTQPLYESFSTAWARQQSKKQPDIRIAVFSGHWGTVLYTGLLYALSLASQLVGPMMLQQIVSGLSCLDSQEQGAPITCPTKQHLYL